MTESRARRITRAIQDEYDRDLYAKCRYGRIDILRRGEKCVVYDIEGISLLVPEPNDWYVLSLTDTWKIDGRAVDWGIEPIIAKLRSMDLWKRDLAGEVLEAKEKFLKSKDRDLDNNIEAFWKDNRRAWAKNFDNVNRSGLNMKKDRRYIDDKKHKLKG